MVFKWGFGKLEGRGIEEGGGGEEKGKGLCRSDHGYREESRNMLPQGNFKKSECKWCDFCQKNVISSIKDHHTLKGRNYNPNNLNH